MIQVKFKIPKKNKIHILEDWLTNGHWALKRSFLLNPTFRKEIYREFRDFLLWEPGSYEDGARYSTTLPDMNRVIPSSMDGYAEGFLSRLADFDPATETIRWVELTGPEDRRSGVAPEYVPLVKTATPYIHEKSTMPIVLKFNDEIVGLLMPVRL